MATATHRLPKQQRSGDRRKARVLSPAPEPVQKRKKIVDTRLPSPPTQANIDSDQDGCLPEPSNDDDLPEMGDLPMSDPAPSSPAAKVAERKAQSKHEPKEEEDDEELMEVAHAGAIKTASVNITGSRPVKKVLKKDPYPSPASSSPVAKVVDTSVDSSSWNDLNNKLNVVSSPPTETKGIGKMDYKDAIESDGSLNFFWTDYTEVNGNLCLFGKVLNKKTNSYASCFVKVDNIMRKLYFLPRQQKFRAGQESDEAVDMMDVYNEVDELMSKMNVGIYKIKPCTRKYAFELSEIPKEAEYLKLLYPYTSKFLRLLILGQLILTIM
jgi:DNA polymerase alpha subunit A